MKLSTESNPLKSRYAPRSNVMRRAVAGALMGLALLFGGGPGVAQQTQDLSLGELAPGSVISAVLVVDTDRLWQRSAFGRRAKAEHEQRLSELEAENLAANETLAAEEQTLTTQRAETEAEEFRQLADNFDQKVQQTRTTQLEKNRSLLNRFEQEQEAFFRAATPVFEQIMLDSGAAVILERRSVLFGDPRVDITDQAIALLDEIIGTGATPD